jgi:hypothetical protein
LAFTPRLHRKNHPSATVMSAANEYREVARRSAFSGREKNSNETNRR